MIIIKLPVDEFQTFFGEKCQLMYYFLTWFLDMVIIPVNETNWFYHFLGKAKRLKQAKEEAQQEIEQYRAQREAQYKKYEQSVSGCAMSLLSC